MKVPHNISTRFTLFSKKLFAFRHRVRGPKAFEKLAFLGASVTAQTFERESGELTGYVEAFKINHAAELGVEEVIVNAYPGNRISDAGLISAEEIMRRNPDVVVLELTVEDRSRGVDFDERHLDHLCNICRSRGAIPIFLALPEPGERHPYEDPSYKKIYRYAEANGLLLCAIELPDNVDISEYYRDGVHTNGKGAYYYASCLADFIRNTLAGGWPKPRKSRSNFRFLVNSVPAQNFDDFKTIVIRNESPSRTDGLISIIQKQTIGTHSPVIDIEIFPTHGKRVKQRRSVWDPYCHYTRDSFISLVELHSYDFKKVVIKISNQLPEYATCRRNFAYTEAWDNLFMRSNHPFWVISDSSINLTIKKKATLASIFSILLKQFATHRFAALRKHAHYPD